MQLNLSIALSALLALSSAMILEPKAGLGEIRSLEQRPAFSDLKASLSPKSACDKEDESDCTAFCKANDQTATCTAAGNKITCSCKGGKSESNCEERCLLCMPGKSQLEEASLLFKQGGSKLFKEDL
ncbi:hypothetical protein BLS_006299 [Venturia inaequalis]|uniref:Uncharacterized protein n=1 Tax=Venturia inaequalis TaxID=5025 RepID=A0A8H3VI87_VENIN|nr:hypothetical protein EG328_001208 [Venturia inaequalis]KAE9982292.1 hypothetical protein BLS_006299 [Venturia inaequalis]KAE9990647.1 hypothetical protein EG327_001094 [Venturia inaequalis]RDI83193.1 hypothetical protein Vi05172_g7042 [Venturia inaequalis]